jgi:hypothetical protein
MATALLVDDLCFGHGLPVDIKLLLQRATRAYEDTPLAESLLMEARQLAPDALEVGIALYKFYFYKFRLADAEAIALQTLTRAAELGNFAPDWNALDITAANWSEPLGAERAYLFTLKALAFINLRLERTYDAKLILNKLAELDPMDQVGGSVIRALAERMEEDLDELPA